MEKAQRWPLKFIEEKKLRGFVLKMVERVSLAKRKVSKNPYQGVIDPFSALVDAAVQGITLDQWMEQEKLRQVQKALQNSVGEFHQNVIGSMPGWENAGAGGSYDVINRKRKIIAEIKNKYNTLNSGSSLNLYNTLANHLDYGDKGYMAYYVSIITKNKEPFNKTFTPPRRGLSMVAREDLRQIDGRSFYDLAAGERGALKQLYNALPTLLEDILGRPMAGNGAGNAIGDILQDAPLSPPPVLSEGSFNVLFDRAFD